MPWNVVRYFIQVDHVTERLPLLNSKRRVPCSPPKKMGGLLLFFPQYSGFDCFWRQKCIELRTILKNIRSYQLITWRFQETVSRAGQVWAKLVDPIPISPRRLACENGCESSTVRLRWLRKLQRNSWEIHRNSQRTLGPQTVLATTTNTFSKWTSDGDAPVDAMVMIGQDAHDASYSHRPDLQNYDCTNWMDMNGLWMDYA